MKALIQGTRICQIVSNGQEFPVAPDLKWVDVADGTTTLDTFVDNAVVKYQYVVTYREQRAAAFKSIGDQLDMQYWDAVNGTTTWKDHVAKVKSDNPKP